MRAAGSKVPKRLRIHDLRHTHAAWLLSWRVPVYVVQRRLGHSSSATTQDVYGHVTPDADDHTLEQVDRKLPDLVDLDDEGVVLRLTNERLTEEQVRSARRGLMFPAQSGRQPWAEARCAAHTRLMDIDRRASGRRATLALVVVVVLSSWSGCDAPGSGSRSTDAQREENRPSEAVTDFQSGTAPGGETPSEVEAAESAQSGPRPCPSQPWGAWTTEDRRTENFAGADIGDLVVDQDGTATLALDEMVGNHFNARTLSLPAAEGDPQKLPGPPPNMQPVPDGAEVSAHFPLGTHLGVDDSGTLTALFEQDLRERGGVGTEYYDVVLSDRPAGRAWSPEPHVAGTDSVYNVELAVNAAGAAVVAWYGFEQPVLVTYRPAAGAAWTPAQSVASDVAFVGEVGIDDAGRVVMLYGTRDRKTVAVRGTPVTGWSRPTPLAGNAAQLEVSAGGAALVTVQRGRLGTQNYTFTMSPSGTWGAAVRQSSTRSLEPGIAIDGAGHAAYMYWNRRRLMIRWSGRHGQWRKPCVLADGVSNPRYYDEPSDHIAVNSRGDAVVVYRNKNPTPQLWARYKPAGQSWTEPIEATAEATGLQSEFRAAIGPSGHAAIAWVTPKFKQLDLVRMAPAH